jgi:hypothetical protein
MERMFLVGKIFACLGRLPLPPKSSRRFRRILPGRMAGITERKVSCPRKQEGWVSPPRRVNKLLYVQGHKYTSPIALMGYDSKALNHTMCVPPSFAAFSSASYRALSLPT